MDFENKVLNILGEILQRVSNIEERVSVLEKDIAILKQDVSGLKQDVSGLKQDVSGLKQDVSLLKAKVFLMDEKLDNLEEKIDELKEDYISLNRTVTKMEYDNDTKFKALFDYIEVNRDEHKHLENLINSKISENRIFFKTILDNHEKRFTRLESAKIS